MKAQAAALLIRAMPVPVVQSWLLEFGYRAEHHVKALADAFAERGPRLATELDRHGKRMAERAQMERGRTFVTGRSGVIR